MEYIAIGENQKLDAIREKHLLKQHPRQSFRASLPKLITPVADIKAAPMDYKHRIRSRNRMQRSNSSNAT